MEGEEGKIKKGEWREATFQCKTTLMPGGAQLLCSLLLMCMAYLLVLVLLQIAWRHQAFWVDISGDWLYELRVRVHVLHFEEGQNILDLQIVGTVCHCLPLGGQATCSHPVGILFLLERRSQT